MGKANLPFTVKSQLIAHTQIKAQLKLWPTLKQFCRNLGPSSNYMAHDIVKDGKFTYNLKCLFKSCLKIN